ncbi:long-chain fatty acid transport protein [Salmonella enterica]|uniref:Long-chain fatty acid transport protein n=1 Tax=Salmonella sp. NCTC 6947 TaxID=2583581 RepID=A0A509BTR2_9ENTR|nr:long-chain fatty acid transport protein [Salmonella enterica]
MSQKTLFTKSALAVAVAIISTQAWSAGFQLNEFFFLWPWPGLFG